MNFFKRYELTALTVITLLSFTISGCANLDMGNLEGMVNAGMDMVDTLSMSDEEIAAISRQAAEEMDAENDVAPDSSSYSRRLRKLVRNHVKEDGLDLNFKVYMSPTVNAFAMADGTVRIYSGLMDLMSDDELLGVIGHEIGHVKHGHSKERMKTAYIAAMARSAVANNAGSATASALAKSDLGALVQKFINAQWSQSNEEESDSYGLQFLLGHGYDPLGVVGAMEKLAEGSEGSDRSLFSSHPAPADRAARLREELENTDFSKVVVRKKSQMVDPVTTGSAAVGNQGVPADTEELMVASVPSMGSNSMGSNTGALGNGVSIPSGSVNIGNGSIGTANTNYAGAIATGEPSNIIEKISLPTGWYVQVAAPLTAAEAQLIAESLQATGYSVAIAQAVVEGITYNRVLVGPQSNQKQAKFLLQQLRSEKYVQSDAFVRKVY